MTKALLTIAETAHAIGAGRTRIYNLISEGRLRAVKLGASTRIIAESVAELVAALPSASIKAPEPRDRAA
jgi:excisionase family DNA binding protein